MNEYQKSKAQAFATVAVSDAIGQGCHRHHAIVVAREIVMSKTDLPRRKAELACWQAYADLEKTPGIRINREQTSDNLLVMDVVGSDQQVVITLGDLYRLINGIHSLESVPELIKVH